VIQFSFILLLLQSTKNSTHYLYIILIFLQLCEVIDLVQEYYRTPLQVGKTLNPFKHSLRPFLKQDFIQDLKRIFYFRDFLLKLAFGFFSPLVNVCYWVAWAFSWIFIWTYFSFYPVRSYYDLENDCGEKRPCLTTIVTKNCGQWKKLELYLKDIFSNPFNSQMQDIYIQVYL